MGSEKNLKNTRKHKSTGGGPVQGDLVKQDKKSVRKMVGH